MHVHKMNTHTSSFFLISFKDFEMWGVPVDLVAKRMTKSRSDTVLQQALQFLSSFPLPLIIFHPHPSPARYGLSLGMVHSDYADVSKPSE